MQHMELLAQVHDSILFQYPIDKIPEMAKAIHTMRDYMNPELEYHGRTFRIETDMKVGKSWGDMKEVPITGKAFDTMKNLEKTIGEEIVGLA